MARFFIPSDNVGPTGPMGPAGPLASPFRGAISRQASGTVTISTANTYVPVNLLGTLDTDTSVGMGLSDTSLQIETGTIIQNVSGLKNTGETPRTVAIIATYDGKAANNQSIGLKLALNATPIDETECTSFGGPGGQFAKTMTQWILRLEAGDEVAMLAANKDGTTNVSIARYKMIAYAI